jgi:LacI family transcriptional regulator
VRPALTTLRIRIVDMGRNALERLVRIIESAGSDVADTACEVVRPELVVRPSSNPAIPTTTPRTGVSAPAVSGMTSFKGEDHNV